MDKVFQKFLRSGIDLSPVGVERREDNNPYFCTPKGASIFGWAGVDGIHFCFVRGFGGMVFSVSPMNSAPDFVHPLANDFEDFLRLLLACSDSAALEQAWMWDKAQFEAFLQDNPPTQEQQMQIDLDNPLCLDFIPRLELNGKTMLTSHGCSVVFNPCLPDGVINEAEAKWALEHYDLDTSYGWMIFRAAFPWTSKRRPEIKALSLTMEQQSCRVPGPHFKAHAPGDSFSFLHPVSGKKYTLTVQELEQQTISEKRYGSDRWFYPTHFTAMSYTLSPEPDSDVTICDCAEGDKPLEIAPCSDRYAPEARNDIACIGIIGGADGPIAIVCGDSSKEKLHAVCSSLHFEPVEGDIEWRIVFNIKSSNEMSLGLI